MQHDFANSFPRSDDQPSFGPRNRLGLLLAAALFAAPFIVAGVYVVSDWYKTVPDELAENLAYVGREKCIECHQEEYDLWHGSDHDRAMDHATEETVLADFNDTEFTHIGFDDIAVLSDDDARTLLAHTDLGQLAVGLADAKFGVEAKLRANMTDEQRDELDALRADLGVLRPCDITWAQQETDELMRRLKREGQITIDVGVTSRFFRDGEKFMVTTDNRDGDMETFEVKYVFGVRPLQQYLIEFPDGRVQCLPIAWDVERERWYHLYPKEQIPYNDPLHWTKPLQNWNYMCAECHSTNLKKNFDVETNTYATTWSEIDVSCETCHGPGSLHVALAEANSLFWDRKHGMGLPGLKDAESQEVIDTCGPCHARRRVVHAGPTPPKTPFMDYFMPEMIDDQLYYADGQILDEDYVYSSFLQARMYHEQVRCVNCHDPHSIKLKFDDNKLCTQPGCHIAAQYDTPTHHHHPDSSRPGTLCVECHMPETTYMVVDPRRDHSIRVPRPDLTSSLKIPNACNLCHDGVRENGVKETPEWATEKCLEWYGEPDLSPHFAHGIAGGRVADPVAIDRLVDTTTKLDVDVRPIVRASAVTLLGNYDSPQAEAARVKALEDDNGLLRAAAVMSFQNDLARAPDARAMERVVRRLTPRLKDEYRAVRIEAARILSNAPQSMLRHEDRKAFDAALAEYMESQEAVADQAAAHLNRGVVLSNLVREDLQQARLASEDDSSPNARETFLKTVRRLTQPTYDAYETAVRIDPEFLPVRFNLAMLCNERGEKEEAERHLREAIDVIENTISDDAQLADAHYSLALLLAEDEDRLAEAETHLAKACELVRDHPRMAYNHALSLQQLGRIDDAIAEYKRAILLEPNQPDFHSALAILHAQQEDWSSASEAARKLVTLSPDNRQFQQMFAQYLSALVQEGDWPEAEAIIRRAIQQDPRNALWRKVESQLADLKAAESTPEPHGATDDGESAAP